MWDLILSGLDEHRGAYLAGYYIICGVVLGFALSEAWGWLREPKIKDKAKEHQEMAELVIWRYETQVAEGKRKRMRVLAAVGPIGNKKRPPEIVAKEKEAQKILDWCEGGRPAYETPPSIGDNPWSKKDDATDKEELIEKAREFKEQQGHGKVLPSEPAVRTAAAAMGGRKMQPASKVTKRKSSRSVGAKTKKKASKKKVTKKKAATKRKPVRVSTKKSPVKKKAFTAAEKKVMARGRKALGQAKRDMERARL